jgi:hypothetical protein
MDTDDLDRLTLFERAQLLHDATLRRHGEMLDRHDDALARHEAQMPLLRGLIEQQASTQTALREIADRLTQQQDLHAERLARHEEVMLCLAQTLDAVRDMIDRGNGH